MIVYRRKYPRSRRRLIIEVNPRMIPESVFRTKEELIEYYDNMIHPTEKKEYSIVKAVQISLRCVIFGHYMVDVIRDSHSKNNSLFMYSYCKECGLHKINY